MGFCMKTFEQWMDETRPHWREWSKPGAEKFEAEVTVRLMREAWDCATEELATELESLRSLARSVNEALNKGDGVYRP